MTANRIEALLEVDLREKADNGLGFEGVLSGTILKPILRQDRLSMMGSSMFDPVIFAEATSISTRLGTAELSFGTVTEGQSSAEVSLTRFAMTSPRQASPSRSTLLLILSLIMFPMLDFGDIATEVYALRIEANAKSLGLQRLKGSHRIRRSPSSIFGAMLMVADASLCCRECKRILSSYA